MAAVYSGAHPADPILPTAHALIAIQPTMGAGSQHTAAVRAHAWATPAAPEPEPHWSPEQAACPRPCQHVAAEIVAGDRELPADSRWICSMDEAELHYGQAPQQQKSSGYVYASGQQHEAAHARYETAGAVAVASRETVANAAVGVGSIPVASFSLLRELSMLPSLLLVGSPHKAAPPQPPSPARRIRKSVSIGEFSTVRVYETGQPLTLEDDLGGAGMQTPKVFGRCCGVGGGAAKSEIRSGDVSSPTHTEDGPRAVSLLIDRLIVTHFEGWALTNAGAIAEFVGGDELLRQVGPSLIDRLEEMIASLDSGHVHHVGMLPSCVRMGLNHLPHLRTLLHWTVASVRFVEAAALEAVSDEMDDDSFGPSRLVRDSSGRAVDDSSEDDGSGGDGGSSDDADEEFDMIWS